MKLDFSKLKNEWVSSVNSHNKYMLERFFSEIEFAEKLARFYPDQAQTWNSLIRGAVDKVQAVVSAGRQEKIDAVIKEAERLMEPIGKAAKTYTVHYNGHAHIDMNWWWNWPETVALTNDTFMTVLKLMDEFPEFYFSQSQASTYEIIREYNPKLFERIKKRVAEGRWEVTASHWVEGDKNLASGESLVRHLLYTRRFMREHFGLRPEDVPLDCEPDTFGHAVTIPTINTRGGVKWYFQLRHGLPEKPPVFWWCGPDGSRLLVYGGFQCYSTTIEPGHALSLLNFYEKTGLKDWMCLYGIGDHGGGPTKRDILRHREMNGWPIYPNVKLSTTRTYYELLEKHGDKISEIKDELNFEFTGCYTSQSGIKKGNRFGENLLHEAEMAAVLGMCVSNMEYPAGELEAAWKKILFGQFHDILPGSCATESRHYQLGLFQDVAARAGMIKTNSLRAVAGMVDTSFAGSGTKTTEKPFYESVAMGGGIGRGSAQGGISVVFQGGAGSQPFVVFNPTAWTRLQVVTATLWEPGTGPEEDRIHNKQFIVRSGDGKTVPAQKVGQGDYWSHQYVEVAFPAVVGPFGYNTYVVEEGVLDDFKSDLICHSKFNIYRQQAVGPRSIENEYLLAEFDVRTGGLAKLIDKKTGTNLVDPAGPFGVLEYLVETTPRMSSWVIGEPRRRVCPIEILSFEDSLKGPHVASMIVKAKINDSTVTVTWSLKSGDPRLEMMIQTSWLERGSAQIGTPTLRAQFPLALSEAKARYEIPFGSIQRDLNQGEEVPSLRWADVTGKVPGGTMPAGMALLNDSKYGHSLEGSTFRVTLIRSSHDPDPLPELGDHTIRLALVPHGNALSGDDLVRLGADFNHPLMVVGTDIHEGKLKTQGSVIADVTPANVIVTAVKKAEDDDALIFRLLETQGKDSQATITLNPEITGSISKVEEVDFIECPVPNTLTSDKKKCFTVKVPANGLASVKICFNK
jgi:alpha-mannosidase